jgi:HTH-type transcriptional regulator/antitoxin HigA
MKTKILKTEPEYNNACERIYMLINSSPNAIEPESPEGEEIELLSLIVENYEHEYYPIEAPRERPQGFKPSLTNRRSCNE